MTDYEQNMEQESTQREEYDAPSWLWVLVPVFIILILISFFMLGNLLYNIAASDRYVVELGTGTQGELDLFQFVYDNESGQITVEGTTGEDLVAPGTAIYSTIRLENPTNITLDYILTAKAEFYNEHEIPLEVRLTDPAGNYILGSDLVWVDITELNNVEYLGSLEKGQVVSFGVDWRWKYETGLTEDDRYDTFLGNLATGDDAPGINVLFYTDAVKASHISPFSFFLHERYFCCFCCHLVWLLLLISIVFAIFNRVYKKKLNRAVSDLEKYEELYGPLPSIDSINPDSSMNQKK